MKQQGSSSREQNVRTAEAGEPRTGLQYKQLLGAMNYADQLDAIRPPMPLQFNLAAHKQETSKPDQAARPSPITVDIGALEVVLNPEGLQSGQLFPRAVDAQSPAGTRTRSWFEGEAADRLSECLAEFNIACQSVTNELLAAARADTQMLASLASLALGFAIPTVGSAIQRVFQRAAVQARLGAGPSAAQDWVRLGDASGTIVNSASSTARRALRSHITANFAADDEVQFLLTIRQGQRIATEAMRGALPEIDDESLLACLAGYSAEVLSATVYEDQLRELLGEYREYVEGVDVDSEASPGRGHYTGATTVARIVLADGSIRLAQVRSQEFHTQDEGSSAVTFRSWIPDSMVDLAVAQAHESGAPVLLLEHDQIIGLPGQRSIDRRLPAPPSHYDYVRRPIE